MKSIITISLDNDIIEWLKEQENMSGLINSLLLKEYEKQHHPTVENIKDKINELNQQTIFYENKYWQILEQEKMFEETEKQDKIKLLKFEKQRKLERTKSLVDMAKKNIPEIQEVYKEFKEKNIQITDTKWFLSKVDYIKSLHGDLKLGIIQLREIMQNFELD